uniref:Uncharacterized protein n=1 Tax=Bursaphelenchus xylophilus TaxID=6326 RepID=A0A1I7RWM3_BURXY
MELLSNLRIAAASLKITLKRLVQLFEPLLPRKMPTTDPNECTITASKNKLANIIVYGQLKTNELVKELGGQLPNNAKQLARELIAAAARTLRPDTTTELVRDILHYRSRKVRCLYKEYKSGKCGELSLEQRLIECEKALLNTLEPDANVHNDFMRAPDIHPNVLEVLSHMHDYIVDAGFRQAVMSSLPAQPLERSDIKSEKSEDGHDNKDAESDGDSVHASSSSYEDQAPATVSSATNSTTSAIDTHTFAQSLHTPLCAEALMSSQPMVRETPAPSREPKINGLSNGTNGLTTAASRKRKHEESQLELIEMKKDLLRLQQAAFEKQIQMFDEMVGTLREMRRLLEYQKPVAPLQLSALANPPTTSATSPLLGRDQSGLHHLAASYPLLSQLPQSVVNSLAFLQAQSNGTQPQIL